MKKVGSAMHSVIAVVLCLMMIATAGAGTATAKQDQNPSQAGKSSIYFYDVAPGDTHGKGKLMIDVDKHTFVFNGQGFDSSAQITLQARAADSTDYVVFATGKATPSGNLHIAGTWQAAAAPAAVLGVVGVVDSDLDYQGIEGFWLKNEGWFITKVACYYSTDGGTTWKESDHSRDIPAGSALMVSPYHELGVPYNALIRLHAVVLAGDDKTGSQVFRVESGPTWAYYLITGTTQNDHLTYYGTLTWD